jgi:hypothetical protein
LKRKDPNDVSAAFADEQKKLCLVSILVKMGC